MTHRQRVQQLENALADRRLIYFGTRGTDAAPLLQLEALTDVFCQIAPLDAPGVNEFCIETVTGRRVDLDSYSIDQDSSDAVMELRAGMLRAFGRRAAVLSYRPTALVASAWFPRAGSVLNLGLFHEHQSCFEHKPWVETQLSAIGVRILPWSYYSDDDRILIREAAERGPLVLRANRSDGGVGVKLIQTPEELEQNWPTHVDGFLAAARYLSPSVPLNVNACVFADGEVAVHAASIQLIGIPQCTNRPFGYCGNDFASVRDLGIDVLDELDRMTRNVGGWLAKQGYLGAFGIDALLHDGKVYLVELNPRLQGSSLHAAELDKEQDRPDLLLNHLAAFLRLQAPPRIPLSAFTLASKPRTHIVCHNLSGRRLTAARVNIDALPLSCRLIPGNGVAVDSDAVLGACVVRGPATSDGTVLHAKVTTQVASALSKLYP